MSGLDISGYDCFFRNCDNTSIATDGSALRSSIGVMPIFCTAMLTMHRMPDYVELRSLGWASVIFA